MKKDETKEIKSKNENTHLKNDLHMNYRIDTFNKFYQSIWRRTELKHAIVLSANEIE